MTKGPSFLLFGVDILWRLRRDQLGYYRELQARFGDRVRLRLGPYRNWLLFSPADVEAVLTIHAGSFIRFEPMMRVLGQWNGNSLLVSEGTRWQVRRRQVLPAFARSRMTGYGARIVTHAAALSQDWDAAADEGEVTVDTDRTMATLALRIALDVLFDSPTDHRLSEISDAVAVLSEVAFRESMAPWKLSRWWPFGPLAGKLSAIRTMDNLVRSIVQIRMQHPQDDRGDLLSTLVASKDEPDAIRDEVMTLLIAGHETTGAALAWAGELLARHPVELAAVVAEMDRELGRNRATAADLGRLPLLRAVIEELLRLFPPAYALFTRQATRRIDLDGITIRKGDLVQLVPFITHRDPRWFDDPEAFRPARFIGTAAHPPYAYFPFGAGPRVCIGQNFGLIELMLVLATLLQDWTPLPPAAAAMPEAKFSLRPRGGVQQRWRRRIPPAV